jgi:hypothetical protein
MLGVTAFGIFFTPVFYSVIRKFTQPKDGSTKAAPKVGGADHSPTNDADVTATDGHAAPAGLTTQPAH